MDPARHRAAEPPGWRRCSAGSTRTSSGPSPTATGPLLVVAGAGTGKTQVITRRIAWLIATRRARPSEILALTFTDKAAEEMAVRVDQLVPYGYTDTAISTFHAFGDGLIREYALELGLPTDVRVLSRAEVVIFLREHLFEFELDAYRPLGDPTRFLAALATLFSRCKDEDIAPGRLPGARATGSRRGRALRPRRPRTIDASPTRPPTAADEAARRQAELARAYATYQRPAGGQRLHRLRRPGRARAAARPRRRPRPASAIAGRFRYILVDEFQDTNRAQAELVALLAERHRNVTVVGDDDQAIYAFRGAAIDNILEFQDRYRGARTVVLRRNYRSLAPILDAAYRLIRFNDPDRLEVRTGVSSGSGPQRVDRRPRAGPARGLRDRRARRRTGSRPRSAGGSTAGAAPRDHAVLVRANGHADPILRALNIAGIPWRFSGTSGLYARPEVRLLLAFLRVVADLDVERRRLRARGLGRLRARRRGPDRHRHHGPPPQPLGLGDPRGARSTARHPARLARHPDDRRTGSSRTCARYATAAHERPAGEVLYALPARQRAARPPGRDRHAGRRGGAPEHRPLLRDRPRAVGAARRRSRGLRRAATWRRSSRPATTRPPPSSIPDADAVAVLTVHKAKGLEFPVVFLPGLVAGRFPSGGRGEPLALPAGLGRGEPPTPRRPSPRSAGCSTWR